MKMCCVFCRRRWMCGFWKGDLQRRVLYQHPRWIWMLLQVRPLLRWEQAAMCRWGPNLDLYAVTEQIEILCLKYPASSHTLLSLHFKTFSKYQCAPVLIPPQFKVVWFAYFYETDTWACYILVSYLTSVPLKLSKSSQKGLLFLSSCLSHLLLVMFGSSLSLGFFCWFGMTEACLCAGVCLAGCVSWCAKWIVSMKVWHVFSYRSASTFKSGLNWCFKPAEACGL